MKMGIIGTAGRKDDKDRMTKELFVKMMAHAINIIQSANIDTLVSGGAAWADHIAVKLYIAGLVPNLVLYLPAEFKDYAYLGTDRYSPGRISNYYHRLMTEKLGKDSLIEIQQAIDMGAQVHVVPGFKNRNSPVAEQSDGLLAFTFGTHSGAYDSEHEGWYNSRDGGLKDGGTADTWTKSKARIKEHKNLWDF